MPSRVIEIAIATVTRRATVMRRATAVIEMRRATAVTEIAIAIVTRKMIGASVIVTVTTAIGETTATAIVTVEMTVEMTVVTVEMTAIVTAVMIVEMTVVTVEMTEVTAAMTVIVIVTAGMTAIDVEEVIVAMTGMTVEVVTGIVGIAMTGIEEKMTVMTRRIEEMTAMTAGQMIRIGGEVDLDLVEAVEVDHNLPLALERHRTQ